MNRDDIIRMAIDAIGGDMNGQDAQHLAWRLEHFKEDFYEFGPDELLKFVSLIAAAEREACAKVCESLNEDFDSLYVEACAEAIRERGRE